MAKDGWDKAAVIGTLFGAVLTPIVIVGAGYYINRALQDRDVGAKLVSEAIGVLKGAPRDDSSPERQWAVQIMAKYSPVPFPTEYALTNPIAQTMWDEEWPNYSITFNYRNSANGLIERDSLDGVSLKVISDRIDERWGSCVKKDGLLGVITTWGRGAGNGVLRSMNSDSFTRGEHDPGVEGAYELSICFADNSSGMPMILTQTGAAKDPFGSWFIKFDRGKVFMREGIMVSLREAGGCVAPHVIEAAREAGRRLAEVHEFQFGGLD